MSTEPTFNYFAYGSNLLTDRIRVRNKSAVKRSIGILHGYQLTFSIYSDFWKGGTANIIPASNSRVMGMIWTLANSDRANLDNQELGYRAIEVDVEDTSGETLKCRTYVQLPAPGLPANGDGLNPFEKPSLAYKTVVLKGAEEHNFDVEYIKMVKEIPDNGVLDCGLPQLVEKHITN